MNYSMRLLFVCTALLGFTAQPATSAKAVAKTNGRCLGSLCEYNHALRGGSKGLPGLRARLNPPMFRYISQMLGELLSREIQHARLPPIIQETPNLMDGRIVLYNGYVARYRCPQRVVVLTKSPNIMVLQLQNYDVGINTRIAGRMNMMIPMATESVVPTGVLHIDMSGVMLSIELAVENGPKGPRMAVVSCANHIEKIHIAMEKAGGANTVAFLKKFVANFVRDVLPNEFCRMVPKIVDEQINTQLAAIPNIVALTKISATTGLELFSSKSVPDPKFCTQVCGIYPNQTSPLANMPTFPGGAALMAALSQASSKAVGKVSGAHSVHSVCSNCPTSPEDPSAIIQSFSKHLDLRAMKDMFLSVKLINGSASDAGFGVDLAGEFSSKGRGGTPFFPFPMTFPGGNKNRMLEAIVSDYTVNSLLYWAHRKGFFSFRLGPDTPTIGDLLRTTCMPTEDMEDGEMEEVDKEQEKRRRRREVKDEGSLTDAGFCLGDLMPEVRVSYPDEKFDILIHTTRAPSVVFSAKKGGSLTIDVQADADLFLASNKTKVGTVSVSVQLNLALHLKAKTLFGSIELVLKLSDRTGSLGIYEQSFGNMAKITKEMVERYAGDALKKGIPLSVKQSPAQPSTFYNMQSKIVDHGLFVAGDMTMAPALLGTLIYSDTCYKFD